MQGLERIQNRMAAAFNMPLMTTNVGGYRELVMSDEQKKCNSVAGILAQLLFESEELTVSVYELVSEEFSRTESKKRQETLFSLANSDFFRTFILQHFTTKEVYSEGSKIVDAVLNLGLLKLLTLLGIETLEFDESDANSRFNNWLSTKQLEC